MNTTNYRLDPQFLAFMARLCEDCFEEDGTPTDPYRLCAAHAMKMPYEQVGTVTREAFKRAMVAAGY